MLRVFFLEPIDGVGEANEAIWWVNVGFLGLLRILGENGVALIIIFINIPLNNIDWLERRGTGFGGDSRRLRSNYLG
jgi:hypothetical protein